MAAPKVFVSHNHQDNAYCRDFVAALRQGLGSDEAVWYDEHNLGWGKIRREIERELAQRQHFIAILSPTAVESDWVNDEIDAAIDLRRTGSMQTIQFVVAAPCTVPLLLRSYKRIEQPGGTGYPPAEAAARALLVIAPIASQSAPAQPREPVIPPDRFPQRLADLGFTAHSDEGIEYILPPLCFVHAGPFLMGSDPKHDKRAAGDEQPQRRITLPAYEIARFPVTVAEYGCFLRAGKREPNDWPTQQNNREHPVINISCRDAVAYAGWLSRLVGEVWRLPTEAEWEKAARGTAGRIFPWGDAFDRTRCNTSEGGIETTTAVGSYPTGASSYTVQDASGNVWEWCSSEDAIRTEGGVLHGGSCRDSSRYARTAYRNFNWPGAFSKAYYGFRLMRAAPPS